MFYKRLLYSLFASLVILLVLLTPKTAKLAGPNLSSSTKRVNELQIAPGGVLIYTITISNTGDQSTNFLVYDSIPDGTKFAGDVTSSVGVPSYNSTLNRVELNNSILSSEIVTLTFAVTVTVTADISGTQIINHAIIQQPPIGPTFTRTVTSTVQNTDSSSVYLPILLKNFVCTPDPYEMNDTRSTGYLLQGVQSFLLTDAYFCPFPSDPNDYFQVHLNLGEKINVVLTSVPLQSDYDLYLYDVDAPGAIVAQSNSSGLGVSENLNYIATNTGTYYIRVYPYQKGLDADTPYQLSVTIE